MRSRRSVLVVALALVLATTSCKREKTAPAAEKDAAAPAPAAVSQVQVPANSWQVPVDVTPAPPPNPPQSNYLNLGWQTFVALNWPAMAPASGGQNGQPDTSATIGATAANGAMIPTVWSTFRDLSTIMLDQGADPGAAYNQAVTIPSGCQAIGANLVAPGFQPMLIDGTQFQSATIIRDYINQATGNPLVSQNGWYTITDIRLNQSEYAFIQQNGYYLGQNQVAAYAKNGQLAAFPRNGSEISPALPSYAMYGALEVKATWRVLDPATDQNIIPRYYTQWGYYIQQDGKTCEGPTLFGLIGLHILRLTPSMGGTWFWASFQQVDNVSAPSGINPTLAKPNTPNGNCGTGTYNVPPATATGNIPWNGSNTPNDICQVTPIPSDVQAVNQTWQSNLSGTPWQYYEMVNTLNPCPSGDDSCFTFPPIHDTTNQVNLGTFGNNAIETYFQNSSCMTCHGGAAGNGAPQPLTGTNQIFTFVLLNAYMPQNTQTLATRQSIRDLLKTLPQSKAVAAKK